MQYLHIAVTAIVVFAQLILFCTKRLNAVTSKTEQQLKPWIDFMKWLRLALTLLKQFR